MFFFNETINLKPKTTYNYAVRSPELYGRIRFLFSRARAPFPRQSTWPLSLPSARSPFLSRKFGLEGKCFSRTSADNGTDSPSFPPDIRQAGGSGLHPHPPETNRSLPQSSVRAGYSLRARGMRRARRCPCGVLRRGRRRRCWPRGAGGGGWKGRSPAPHCPKKGGAHTHVLQVRDCLQPRQTRRYREKSPRESPQASPDPPGSVGFVSLNILMNFSWRACTFSPEFIKRLIGKVKCFCSGGMTASGRICFLWDPDSYPVLLPLILWSWREDGHFL